MNFSLKSGESPLDAAVRFTNEDPSLSLSDATYIALKLPSAPARPNYKPDDAVTTLADRIQKGRKMDPSVAYQVAIKVIATGGTESAFAQKVAELLDAGVPHEDVLARANRETKPQDAGDITMRLRDIYPNEDMGDLIQMAARIAHVPNGLALVERQRRAGSDIRTAVTVACKSGFSTTRRHGPPTDGVSFERPVRLGR